MILHPPPREAGRQLGERLALVLPKREGPDLVGACPFPGCNSSDAFHLHAQTGIGFCFSCGGKSSPYASGRKPARR
jgi:hypothetical protein